MRIIPPSAARVPLRLAACLGAALAALAFAAVPRAGATDWPQQHSDVPADKAVRYGTLPNGMRYAITRNATPKNAVSMWLNIEAGSLQESDAQQGLAHFLEHMAFRGSRHVPEAEVWPGLQRLGAAIGADSNASTSFAHTVYQFNFPRNDAETIDTGLLRLRDVASELTLAQTAMDAERGAVLSEERLRDTPSLRAFKRMLTLLLGDDVLTRRWPIGQTDVLKHAPVSLIRDYYTAFYQPERATLIVVGEIDPDAIEAKIKALFSDWKPAGPAGHDPVRAAPGPRAPQAALFAEPGAPSSLFLGWMVPNRPDTMAREIDDFAYLVALQILQFRLEPVKSGADQVFAQITPQGSRELPGAMLWSVDLAIKPQDWRVALDAVIRTVRQMQTHGVTADELERAKAGVHAALEAAAADAATRPTRNIARLIATAVNEGEVYTSPADNVAIADKAFAVLTPEKIQATIDGLMRGHGPLILLSSPAPVEGGEAAVAAALAEDMKAPLARPTVTARVPWPYTDFGPPGKVVEERKVGDLATTLVRFANGVRLTVRPTTYRQGEVVVAVRIGNGRLDLPADRATAAWALDDSGLLFGGTKALSVDEIQAALAGKVIKLESNVMDDGFLLTGHTRPQDLAAQLQLAAALVSAPGWRDGALDRARTIETAKLRQAAVSPTSLFVRERTCLLSSGDLRRCRPSLAELTATKSDAFKDVMAPLLAAAPIEVIIVGDITVDAAVDAVARTFGALPQRAEAKTSLAQGTTYRFPATGGAPVALHHDGRADQGLAGATWLTTDLLQTRDTQTIAVLRSVLSTRLLDRLRIAEGLTYAPQVGYYGSNAAPGFGYLYASAELPPAKMPLFYDAVRDIVADLRAHPISADELERARKPALEAQIAREQTNDYWALYLAGAQDDPRRLDAVRDTIAALKAVTAADVQAAANRFLADGKEWKVEITPRGTAAAR
jgi:zinc protease